jgi:hypothetical protein
MTPDQVRKIALSFDETVELPHFEKTSFRVRKKIFATMMEKESTVVLMLSPIDQSVFCAFDNSVMYPVPNKWGKKGATVVELKKVKKEMFKDAIATAYCRVAPRVLSEKYQVS